MKQVFPTLAACLVLSAINLPASAADDVGVESRRWWVGLQLGTAAVLSKPDPMRDAGSGALHFAYGVEGGVRLSRDWLLGAGFDTGKLGSYPCDADSLLCNSIKQEFGNLYLTLGFNPGRGPWLFQIGAGRATYDMSEKTALWGGEIVYADSSGVGARLGVGYDWRRPGSGAYFGWRANLVYADPGNFGGNGDAQGVGSAAYTALLLSFSVSRR